MLKRNGRGPLPSVTMFDDAAFDVSVTITGQRRPGQPCQLTLAVNGAEALSFLEEGGAGAPQTALVDLNLPLGPGRALLDAMSTKPWEQPDTPLIMYARADRVAERRGDAPGPLINYLVRNRPVEELIALIRDTLDIAPRPS